MIEFLHFLGAISGIASIILAGASVANGLIACAYPDSMAEEAKPYFKKSYILLGAMLICIAICCVLLTR
jgi:hypothetical protein